MKLLLDQNLSRKLIAALETRYPGSSHVVLVGMHRSSDSDIWHYAKHHGFALVTKNTDMVDLCVLRGAPPQILWIRAGNCSTSTIIDIIDSNEHRIRDFLMDGGRVALSLFHLTPL